MGNQKKMNFKKLEVLAPNQKCVFCHTSEINELKLGPVYMYQSVITHYYCLLLSSNMQQNGRDSEGILGFLVSDIRKEIKRGKRLLCTYCKKSGATLGCDISRCKVAFHLPCGIQNNSLHQFFNSFKSFCLHHRPVQKIPKEILDAAKETDQVLCTICYDNIDPRPVFDTLWAPCCKKNGWVHRDCVQNLATNAGYFFKCPLCNNKDEFSKTMRDFGIYIPEQDASWESVPNAYEDLYYRHDSCNAMPKCLCPQGRKDNVSGTRWELVLCRLCGSQGMHIGCGKLVWVDPVWECKDCSQIVKPAKRNSDADSKSNLRAIDHLRNATNHHSDSAERKDETSEKGKENELISRRRRRTVDIHKKMTLPSTSATYEISDSPEPIKKRPSSAPIVIDDSDTNSDDDLVIVSSQIPEKSAIVTNDGQQIPVITINDRRDRNLDSNRDIEVLPVQIKIVNHSQIKKPKLGSSLTSNNLVFENTRVQSNTVLQDRTQPVSQNYNCVPSSTTTPQDLYGYTYIIESPQNVEDFPPGTTVYQSVPQDYVQCNQNQQQLGATWSTNALPCHACYPDICQHWTRSCYKPNDAKHQHSTSNTRNVPVVNAKHTNLNANHPNSTKSVSGKTSKLFSTDANKSFNYNIQHVKRLGYNYNRLNPQVVISPLIIWQNDQKIIKIAVLPVKRNNFKRKKRLMPCTNPSRLDVPLRQKHSPIKRNRPLFKLNFLKKSQLKVKMFGINRVKNFKNKANLNMDKLLEDATTCASNNENIIILQKTLLNPSEITLNCNNVFNNVSKLNSFNSVDVKNQMIGVQDAVGLQKTSADVNQLQACSTSNGNKDTASKTPTELIIKEEIDVKPCLISASKVLVSLTQKLNNQTPKNKNITDDTALTFGRKTKLIKSKLNELQDITFKTEKNIISNVSNNENDIGKLQETSIECKYVSEFTSNIEKIEVKPCSSIESAVYELEPKEGINSVQDLVSLTQKQSNQIPSNKKSDTPDAVEIKKELIKNILNPSQNVSYPASIVSNNKNKAPSKSQNLFLNSNSKKQNMKTTKEKMKTNNLRTLDAFFKIVKPVDNNLQNINRPNLTKIIKKKKNIKNWKLIKTVHFKHENVSETVKKYKENFENKPTPTRELLKNQNVIERYFSNFYNSSDIETKNKNEIKSDIAENEYKHKIKKLNQKLNKRKIKIAKEYMTKIKSKSNDTKKLNAVDKNLEYKNKYLQLKNNKFKESDYSGDSNNENGKLESINNKSQEDVDTTLVIEELNADKLSATDQIQEKLSCSSDKHIQNLEFQSNFVDRKQSEEASTCVFVDHFQSNIGSELNDVKNQNINIHSTDENKTFCNEQNAQKLPNSTVLNAEDKDVGSSRQLLVDSLFKTKFVKDRKPLCDLQMQKQNIINNKKYSCNNKNMSFKCRKQNILDKTKFSGKIKNTKLKVKLFNTKPSILKSLLLSEK